MSYPGRARKLGKLREAARQAPRELRTGFVFIREPRRPGLCADNCSCQGDTPAAGPGTLSRAPAWAPTPSSSIALTWLLQPSDKIQGPGDASVPTVCPLSAHRVCPQRLPAARQKGLNLPRRPASATRVPTAPGALSLQEMLSTPCSHPSSTPDPRPLSPPPGGTQAPVQRSGLLGMPGADLSQQRWPSRGLCHPPRSHLPPSPSRDNYWQEVDAYHSLALSIFTAFLCSHNQYIMFFCRF